MLYIVTGGSGSGKSEYAENLAMTLCDRRVYIATMKVYGEEGRMRVERHRKLRAGKGFMTIECPINLEQVVIEAKDCRQMEDCVFLLECMSNLVANEMFSEELSEYDVDSVKKRILDDVHKLMQYCRHLIIVTNEVFSDGTVYDTSTTEYIRCLGKINMTLAAMADQVIEVVCGIPVPIK